MQSSEHIAEDKQPEDAPMSEDVQNMPQVHIEQRSLPSPPLNEEAIRQGLIYPPPPDFYTRMPAGPQPPPPAIPHIPKSNSTWTNGIDQQTQKSVLPAPKENLVEREAAHNVNSSTQPGIHPSMPPGLPYPASQLHTPYSQVKPSYTWVWLLITGLAILIFGSCILATWLGYSMFGSELNNQYDANTIGLQHISDYYGAIQSENYVQAYSYLHPAGSIHNLTQAQFIQRAQQQDAQFGSVLNFNPDIVDIPNGGDTFTNFKESVTIGRMKEKSYTVNLTFQKIGSTWYITDFDKI